MEVKKGFKQTDIGIIPNDWETLKIKDFTHVVAGGTPSTFMKEYWNGEIKWMNSGELNLKKIFDVENRITEQGLKFSSTRLIPEKCTLIGLAGQGKTRGTVAINMVELCTNQSIAAVYPSTKIISEYLYYNLDSRYNELRNLSTGDGGRGGLNLSIIKNLLIAFPVSKVEQENISQALTGIDNLIASIENLIKKKRNIKWGAMQRLLCPKAHWEMKTYGEVFLFLNTATYSRAQLSDCESVGYVHYGDIHTKWNSFLDVKNNNLPTISEQQLKGYSLLKNGDIVMADASEDYSGVGKCVEVKNLANRKVIAGLHTFLLRDTKGVFIDGYRGYIHTSTFIKKQFDRLATGLKVYGVSKSNLKKVVIPVPSKEEQIGIAETLSNMDLEISNLEDKLEKYIQVRQGMMQQLLTGKIRLV